MGNLTSGQLPNPQRLTDPTGGYATSSAGAIGGALSGLADVADAYFKYQGNKDANAQDQKLNDLILENFGSKNEADNPQLVGQGPKDPTEAVAAADPTVKDAKGKIDRLHQANQQGSLSSTEFYTRAAVIVQDSINKNPAFAAEMRQHAQAVLGVQPTQELLALQKQDDEQKRSDTNTVLMTNVQAADQAGIRFFNPDGSYNFDKMADAGSSLLFQQKKLTDQIRAAQLEAASRTPAPTHEQTVDAETGAVIKSVDPVFKQVAKGVLSGIPAMMQQAAAMKDPEKQAHILQQIGIAQAQMGAYLDNVILTNNISPDGADKLRKRYNGIFENYKVLAGSSDFSYVKTLGAQMQALDDEGQIDLAKTAPFLTRARQLAGPQGVAGILSVFMNSNTEFRETMDAEANAFVAHPTTVIANHNNYVSGAKGPDGKPIQLANDPNPETQKLNLKGLVATLNGYTQTPNTLGDAEQNGFGNAIVQVATLGMKSSDPKVLSQASATMSSPATLQTFDAFAKNPKNANAVPGVAQAQIALHTQAVMRNVPVLMQGSTVNIVPNASQYDYSFNGLDAEGTTFAAPLGLNVKTVPYFNPSNGRIGFNLVATDNKGAVVPLEPADVSSAMQGLQSYTKQVNDINQSLDAVTHLASYGVGREKDLKPLEIKQIITMGSGLPVKEGMKPVPMPGFMEQKKEPKGSAALPPDVMDRQLQQESGGKSQAELEALGKASKQGAVGPWQIRPEDFPQYDAKKLRGDTPEDRAYADKAHAEIMGKLIKKYKGNIRAALAEYHGGPDPSIWGSKTFGYVNSIVGNDGQ